MKFRAGLVTSWDLFLFVILDRVKKTATSNCEEPICCFSGANVATRRDGAMTNTERPSYSLSNLTTRVAVGHKKGVNTLTWNRDGSQLIVAGDDVAIRVFDAERLAARDLMQEKDSRVFNGHSGIIEQLVASPVHPSLFASTGQDKLVNIYDTRLGPSPVKFAQTSGLNASMDWAPDGRFLMVVDRASNLYAVRFNDMNVEKKFETRAKIEKLSWSRSGKLVFLASANGTVEVLKWPELNCIHVLRGHRDGCSTVSCDPTGQRIAVSSQDACITVWNASTLNCVYAIDRSETAVRLADFSHDGRYLASANVTNGVEICSADSGARVHKIHSLSSVRALKWHPKYLLLAYCVDEDTRRPVMQVSRMYPSAPQPIPPHSRAYVYGYPPPKPVMNRSTR